jgi:methylmalonyl-CoA mutase
LFNLIAKEYDHKLDCHLLVTPTKKKQPSHSKHAALLLNVWVPFLVLTLSLIYLWCFVPQKQWIWDRIARNQLLILKNESYFDKVNPADGSYYIEKLTNQLAEKALALFKTIEENGGYLKYKWRNDQKKNSRKPMQSKNYLILERRYC